MSNICKCTLELFLNRGTYTYRYSVSGKNLPSIYYPLNITATNNPSIFINTLKKKKNKALNTVILELPRGLSGKEPACLAGDTGSIPGPGRSPGGRNGNSFQHSCLGNPMDRGAWRATVFGGHKRVGHDLVTKHHYHL